MGKNITEFDNTVDKVHVGGSVQFQDEQPPRIELAGKVFVRGSSSLSKENGDFGQDLIDYINSTPENLDNSCFNLTTEVSSSWRTIKDDAPKAKNYHWHEEIVLGDYTYMPISDSCDFGNSADKYLGYLRIHGTNQTVTRHNIRYVGAGSPQDTSQTYAGFLMISNGTKLLAYFRTSLGMECYTSTDGLTWTDETSSFNLSATLGTTSMHTQTTIDQERNMYGGFIHTSGARYHSVASYGSRFVWIGNDGTNFKFWSSADGLTWTDITSSITPTAGLVGETHYVNVAIDQSQSKAFIYVVNGTSGIYVCAYTTDGGVTWSQGTGLQTGSTTYAPEQIVKNPLDADKFLITRTSSSPQLSRTEDFGATWTAINTDSNIDKVRGIAYFGDYIYLQLANALEHVNYSSDNGANFSYWDGPYYQSPYFMTDLSRVIISTTSSMVYSTDNITFNENYALSNSYFRNNCVAIDANTTIFSGDDDDQFVVTTDGCVTFTSVSKYNETVMRFDQLRGVSAHQIGYLENAKMIGNVIDSSNSDDNTIFFVERIKNPNWAQTPDSSNIAATETRHYFRTK